ncbi:MAG: AAA family ATPase [Lachnospiraceae bacterium]|jgi:cytidylate kinase|nr:AAA family ATPase [Lachnospiraceae bacterium]
MGADTAFQKGMHITLTGNLGSGKSTICRILENEYGKEIYSTGKVQRAIAQEMGISVLEMNQLMCKDHKYDHLIDDTTAKISRENPDKPIVFDSRLAWNFVEKSFKVFLSVNLSVAAERVFNDNRGNVESYTTVEDAKRQLSLRAETEDVRYKELYGLDYFDFSNYNLVLDSTYCAPQVLAKLLIAQEEAYEKELAAGKNPKVRLLISPKRLGEEMGEADFSKERLYPEGIVTVRKSEEDFCVVSGQEIVAEAVRAGMPFVMAAM